MGYVNIFFKDQDMPDSVVDGVEATDLLDGFLVIHHNLGSHHFALDSILIWSYHTY